MCRDQSNQRQHREPAPARTKPRSAGCGSERGNLARLADLHGVSTSYAPAPGRIRHVPDDTVVAVLAALGVDASTPRAVRTALDQYTHDVSQLLLPPYVVTRPGRPARLNVPDGTVLRVDTEDGGVRGWGPEADDVAAGRGTRQDRDQDPNSNRDPERADHRDPRRDPNRVRSAERHGQQEWDRARRHGQGDGLDAALPFGCHTLRAHAPGGRSAVSRLIVAPDRMPERPGRTHGFLVQLYSLLSARSWGMGDLGDLADLAAWSGRTIGAGFLQLNPLHAAVPGAPTDPSPYRPSSRRFPDPSYLRVADVPEYAQLRGADRARVDELLVRADALRDAVLGKGALIDRDATWDLKREALELVRKVPLSPGRRAAYCDYLAERGQALDDHATWCVLAERYGPDWRSWPSGLSDPRSGRTARFRGDHLDQVDFHCWLSWLTDAQLAAAQRTARDAGMGIGLIHDLAIGVHPFGADAWAQQHVFAAGMSIGAPPDAFTSRGQDWGLPPWRPDALAASAYAPYRELLRGMLRHAGALRIDHVMGLFRLWWVPQGREPIDGCYVRYDAEAMLGMLALEAHRANALVIGEDLGTVEPGIRETLAERGVLGTSVLWFERAYAQGAVARDGAAHDDGPLPDAAHGDVAQDGAAHGGAVLAGARAPEAAAPEAAAGRRTPARAPRPLAPGEWRTDCLATATTHDLPSTAARLTGEHVQLRHRLGLRTKPLADEQARDAVETAEWLSLLRGLGLLREGLGDDEAAIRAVYRFLARTPARLVGVWLPDAVGDRRPQNVPGTSDQYPNWRLPIADATGQPMSLEQLLASPRLRALLAEVRTEVRAEAAAERAAHGPT
ncbi:4-alpha-glucanotransferase [Streptomyces zagrosensis]|uniref:4-alpha-glucanotransferase n=1 Tax=Streptomyces zagrosensis TaxID=1042984 RepID=A0A7W9Q794_9ACTN|nr:4-alpha-glucanotransferase [Streptomyces zagrosensis]MBB5934931.1 4-alpha-glucanotransferase [Streptomyces zagrosensis]